MTSSNHTLNLLRTSHGYLPSRTQNSVSQKVLVSSSTWGSWPDIYYCLTVTVLFLWSAFSDERTGLSFVYAAGPTQRSLSWDSRPYFTVSDLRLPFSSPPRTRRVTVEVFDPASTRVTDCKRPLLTPVILRCGPAEKMSRDSWSATSLMRWLLLSNEP
jgi:hypothetical protein